MRRIITAFLMAALVLSAGACTGLQKKDTESTDPMPKAGTSTAQSVGTYADFEDVLIPNEMEIDPKASFMFETPQFKTGILVYKGRVDYVSLANFFENNMIKDNWKMRSKIRYTRTIMVFEKPDRDCIINIYDETFNTIAEVMVAPRMDSRPAESVQTGVQPLEQDLPE